MDWQLFRRRFSRNALAGLAFVLPLALLAFVLWGLSGLLLGAGARIHRAFDAFGVHGPLQSMLAVLVVLVAAPTVLALAGTVLRHRYGERLGNAVDVVLVRTPGIGPVYAGLRRSRRLVVEDGGGFEEVVSLELTDGVDVLAFVVGREGGADWTTGDRRVTVYVPLSPNPTVGGHLLAVRQDRVNETDLTVRAAVTVLVTVGAGDPENAEPPLSGLYRRLEDDVGEDGGTTARGNDARS